MQNQNPTDTLFSGRTLKVQLRDGTETELQVRQLPLADYEKAFSLLEDEIGLVAFISGRDKAWAYTLDPLSYETLHDVAQEVNARGFFAWSQRRKRKMEQQQTASIAALAHLPPETIRLAMEAGTLATSPSGSPLPRPR